MICKKRPRCVPVNKYKLKTKKAMAKRCRIVRMIKFNCLDWDIARQRFHAQSLRSSSFKQEQISSQQEVSKEKAHSCSYG